MNKNEVTFHPKGLQPAAKVRLEVTLDLPFEERVDSTKIADSSSKKVHVEHQRLLAHHLQEVTILEATGATTSKVDVAYPVSKHEISEGAPLSVDSPVAGKTYALTFSDGSLSISKVGGALVPDEADWLQRHHSDLGKVDLWVSGLTSDPLSLGADVGGLAPAVKGALDRWATGGAFEPADCSVSTKLQSVTGGGSGQRAVFAVRVNDQALVKTHSTPTIDLTGELVLEGLEGRPSTLHLRGKVTSGTSTMAGPLTRAGELQLALTWTYR